MRKLTFIDHYDSFSFNLIDWLSLHAPDFAVDYCAFDDSEKMLFLQKKPTAFVFSPGPKSPADAPLSCELLKISLGKVPVLGVCLGFQIMGLVAGGSVRRSSAPRHGLTREIRVTERSGLLREAPERFKAASYNSLTLDCSAMMPQFIVSGVCESNEPQIIEYRPKKGLPALGVQFHPESFLNDDLRFLLRAVFHGS